MMRARCLSAARLNSVLFNGAPVCLPPRPSVRLSVRRSLPQTQPSSARHRPVSLPPRPSVPMCPGPARVKLHRHDRGKKGEKRAEKKGKERKERKEAVLTVIHPSAPLLSLLSLSHSEWMSLYQSRSLLLSRLSDVKCDAVNASASCRFFQNKTLEKLLWVKCKCEKMFVGPCWWVKVYITFNGHLTNNISVMCYNKCVM